jgi:hypothetical protein
MTEAVPHPKFVLTWSQPPTRNPGYKMKTRLTRLPTCTAFRLSRFETHGKAYFANCHSCRYIKPRFE